MLEIELQRLEQVEASIATMDARVRQPDVRVRHPDMTSGIRPSHVPVRARLGGR
jgi:hypothetical protein